MRRATRWLFAGLALQNLGRRRVRTLLLALAVALGSGAVFATLTLLRGIERSMTAGFHRLGADLLVVPDATMVNLTGALLTVEPTAHTLGARLAEELARIPGVSRVSPQTLLRVPASGGHDGSVDVIAFDPARDFTVIPWLGPTSDRPPRRGDVILGGRREERVGNPVTLCGEPLRVYGRLEVTGVGPFDHSLFVTYETATDLARACRGRMNESLAFDPDRVSALLILLEEGTTPERVRFAAAQAPGVKVVSGGSLVTSIRQGATALLGGVLVLALGILASSVVLIGLLFSAIIAERSREVGLLMALGSRGQQVVRMFLVEAVVMTGLGGLLGVVLGGGLLLLFRRSVGYYFEMHRVPFDWPSSATMGLIAVGCVSLAAALGLLGATIPAWRASRREPHELIHSEAR